MYQSLSQLHLFSSFWVLIYWVPLNERAFLQCFPEAYRQPLSSVCVGMFGSALLKKIVKFIWVSIKLCPKRKPNLIIRKFPFQREIPREAALTLQCNKHSTPLCFPLLPEDHPCTYWIVHEGLKGYPTKNPDPECSSEYYASP